MRGDFKVLHRKLERALTAIERSEDVERTLERILGALVADFGEELGLTGGRIYKREDGDYYLCCGFGSSRDPRVGLRVPRDYAAYRRTLEEGVLILHPGDPGYDEGFERRAGVEAAFASIAIGRDHRFVIGFSVEEGIDEERVVQSLIAVRHVINLKLEQQRFTGLLDESRAIQEGMLPLSPPRFPGYDIAGTLRSAHEVGGDLFDYLPLSRKLLGVAVVDSSGHGFPAALMARDAITGLRTLADETADVGVTVGKVNGIIHRAALASKFVSMFYARIVAAGAVTYCNAGHVPPLLDGKDGCVELMPGGPVLGPIADSRYEAGEARLRAGDRLLIYTDGLVEAEDRDGEPFGTQRLRDVLRSSRGASAEDTLGAIVGALDGHLGDVAPVDDVTVVVVRRAEPDQT